MKRYRFSTGNACWAILEVHPEQKVYRIVGARFDKRIRHSIKELSSLESDQMLKALVMMGYNRVYHV